VRFLAACLSLKEWDAGVVLRYSEQSAMEVVIERVSFFVFLLVSFVSG